MQLPRSTVLLATALAVLTAASSRAGEIVIPLAANHTVQGLSYTTRVWVANPTNAQQSFTAAFYAAGADGTSTPASSPPQLIDAGDTRVYSSATETGASGMLAIRGATGLQVSAALETRAGQNLLGSVAVPVLTAETAFAANAVGHLAGLERTNGAGVSDLYLFNLEATAAQCTVKVFQANGGQIGATAQLALAARQRRDFVDTLNLLGRAEIADVRIEASCNRRFWLAALQRRGAAAANLILPSAGLAGDVLGTPPPPPPPDNSVRFAVPGLFLNAKANAAYKSYELPATQGVDFRKAVIEFDLKVGKFQAANFTGVHAFRRPHQDKRSQVLYYGLQINNYKTRTILDLGLDDALAKGTTKWESGKTYHLRFTYDVVERSIALDVFLAGQRLERVTGSAHNFDLKNDGHPLVVDFGMVGVGGDGGYVPPLGWQYSDLTVVLTP